MAEKHGRELRSMAETREGNDRTEQKSTTSKRTLYKQENRTGHEENPTYPTPTPTYHKTLNRTTKPPCSSRGEKNEKEKNYPVVYPIFSLSPQNRTTTEEEESRAEETRKGKIENAFPSSPFSLFPLFLFFFHSSTR